MISQPLHKEVAVISSDPVLLRLISRTLSSVQLKIDEFSSPPAALFFVRQNFQNIYLIVIDISDSQAHHFIQELKENEELKFIPVLAMTGRKDNKVHTMISSAYNEKIDDLVFKPIDPAELLFRSSRLMELRGSFFSMKDKIQGSNQLVSMLENKLKDITRIYHSLEHDYQHQKEKAQEKEEYFYTIAHDLVSPLSNITLGVDFILSETSHVDPNDASILTGIKDTALRINKMVRDFLTMIKQQREAELVKFENMNPSAILEIVLREFYPRANEKNVLIMLEIDENVQNVYWDQSQILRVIANLVDNAIQYSPEHETIILSLKQIEDLSVFIIADKGPGIPAEELDKIFDLFYQAEAGKKGFGIGLAFCKKIIERHNGRIEIQSEIGQGTRFQIILPNHPEKV